jgi:hypothetical protein
MEAIWRAALPGASPQIHLGPCVELFFFSLVFLHPCQCTIILFIHTMASLLNTTAMIMRCTVCQNPVCAAYEPDIYELVGSDDRKFKKPLSNFFIAHVHVWTCRSPTSSTGTSKKSFSCSWCIYRTSLYSI